MVVSHVSVSTPASLRAFIPPIAESEAVVDGHHLRRLVAVFGRDEEIVLMAVHVQRDRVEHGHFLHFLSRDLFDHFGMVPEHILDAAERGRRGLGAELAT